MKLKAAVAFSSTVGVLIMSTSADGAYTGLELVNVTSYFDNHTNASVAAAWDAHNAANGGNAQVWRLFATFSGNTTQDRVNVVYGNGANPMTFTMIDGTVHNYTGADPGSPVHYDFNPPTIGGANAVRSIETYATINQQAGTGGATPLPGSMDAGQINHFLGTFSANNAAWFITPDNTLGVALGTWQGAPGFKVLVLQLSVIGSEGLGNPADFCGSINLQTGFGEFLNQSFVCPAPGALWLLGLVALRSRRFRRRK